MQTIDWIVLVGALLGIVVYGTWKTRKKNESVEDYLKADAAKWFGSG